MKIRIPAGSNDATRLEAKVGLVVLAGGSLFLCCSESRDSMRASQLATSVASN